jgi:hypothetical protein
MSDRHRRLWVYVALNVAAVAGLFGYTHHVDAVNHRDHLRSCLAQNAGRRETNVDLAAGREGWLTAARARELSAALPGTSAAARRIDRRAAARYRAVAARYRPLPTFDCRRVVR